MRDIYHNECVNALVVILYIVLIILTFPDFHLLIS